jgi:hypothetical protein
MTCEKMDGAHAALHDADLYTNRSVEQAKRHRTAAIRALLAACVRWPPGKMLEAAKRGPPDHR